MNYDEIVLSVWFTVIKALNVLKCSTHIVLIRAVCFIFVTDLINTLC